MLKAKAIAEENIRRSGVEHTIIRTALVYGLNDHFTSNLARLLNALPFFFFVPEDREYSPSARLGGRSGHLPGWSLDNDLTVNQTYSVGGPEYLTFNHIVQTVLEQIELRRKLVHVFPPYLRAMTVIFESMFPSLPVSVYWLDYLAVNRTCSLDVLTQDV